MILDTSFLSHLINGDREAWDKSMEIHEEDAQKNVTPVVLFELYYGAFSDENEELVRMVGNLSAMYGIQDMGEEEIIEGAKRLANTDIEHGGESGVGQRDGMIAGVAACNDETVLTANADDFEKLDIDVDEFST